MLCGVFFLVPDFGLGYTKHNFGQWTASRCEVSRGFVICLADYLCLLPSEDETQDLFLLYLLPFHAGLQDEHV